MIALLVRADAAFEDMQKLDDGLYQRFVASRAAPDDSSTAGASLLGLWDSTFRGLTALLAHCKTVIGAQQPAPEAEAAGELDFGEHVAPSRPASESELDLALDLGAFVDGIDADLPQPEAARWAQVLESLAAIEYGLSSQQADAQTRMKVALIGGQTNQVLALLDDTQGAASEGVHAVFTAVYKAFMPEVETRAILPGYLTSLSRALLVRRGIADLSADLESDNQILHGDRTDEHDAALASIRSTVRTFVRSAVCHAMRPADRFQMVEFDRALAEQRGAVVRTTSEGLVKYLESLATINQREVLVEHDRAALEEMREAIANARELVDLSPRTAFEMLVRAHEAARRLRGKHGALDPLIIALDRDAPTTKTPADSATYLAALEQILAAAGT